jgi:hypothetical protein
VVGLRLQRKRGIEAGQGFVEALKLLLRPGAPDQRFEIIGAKRRDGHPSRKLDIVKQQAIHISDHETYPKPMAASCEPIEALAPCQVVNF